MNVLHARQANRQGMPAVSVRNVQLVSSVEPARVSVWSAPEAAPRTPGALDADCASLAHQVSQVKRLARPAKLASGVELVERSVQIA